MDNRVLAVCFLMILPLGAAGIFAQENTSASGAAQTVPEILRRPERGEATRYPVDVVIGELGRGSAPEEAYIFARNLLSNMISRSSAVEPDSVYTESMREEINSLRPRSFRIGGGRTEADGCVSFLIRFLGQNESITGELFIRREEEDWVLDGLFLEEKRTLGEIRDSVRFDFSPYERFF